MECTDVLPEEIDDLRAQLERELTESKISGLGLAAPQIGIPKRMAIVRIGEVKIDLVNCRIKKGFDRYIFQGEGCLSFPGRFVDSLRYREVYVVDNAVEPSRFVTTDLAAVVVQHELDHLDGILLPEIAIKKKIRKKPRPNDLCPCGSGRKYKRCCYR